MNINDKYFIFLEGNWTIHRSINGLPAMTGAASFLPIRDEVPSYSYREEGTFIAKSL